MSRPIVIALSTLLSQVLGCWGFSLDVPPPTAAEASLEREIRATQEADYEGATERLLQLHAAMARDTSDLETGRWAHYWRGYARWRRALNVINDDPRDRTALEDLRTAQRDFARAACFPELAADARSAEAACIVSLAYLSGGGADSMRSAAIRASALLKSAVAAEPDNPRVIWVQSGLAFYGPAAAGGGPDSAIRLMHRGLDLARAEQGRPAPDLAPRWGEAEHLMNLAWAWSKRPDPDLARAEAFAREALRRVPRWHYVREHLLPDIREARRSPTP